MHKRIAVQQLVKLGQKKQDIAEQIGCHRNTVRNIGKETPIKEKKESIFPDNPLDPYKELIVSKIDEGLTLVRIYEYLVEEKGFDRHYDSLRRYVKTRKLKGSSKAYMVLHSEPGEEGQVDFGHVGMTPDNTGKNRKTYVFAMTLGFSRDGFYKHVYDQTVDTFIECHKEAFEYFEGVPQKIKIDNLKAAVLERHFHEPEFQKKYLAFSQHYNFLIHPCKVRYPEEKGKVESGVKYVKSSFFKGRVFKNSNDLEQKLFQWQEEKCNKRIHGTTKKIPSEVFETEEKAKLNNLPDIAWENFSYEQRKVSTTCHIMIDKNYYSVPYRYIGEYVLAKVFRGTIDIYEVKGSIKLATHSRYNEDRKGKYQTNDAHYPEYKVKSQTQYQHEKTEAMKAMGEWAHKICLKIIEKNPKHWSPPIKSILQLRRSYSEEVINLACKRALEFECYLAKSISDICKKGLWRDMENLDLPYISNKNVSPKTLSLNPKDKNQSLTQKLQRPLSYYSKVYSVVFFLGSVFGYAISTLNVFMAFFNYSIF